MSIMENLFMQIFDRKRWIEDQFKHQVESYSESLASNLLSEGHCPPPWLLTFGSGNSIWADCEDLNRKQLISEICNRQPRVTTSANKDTSFILPTLNYNNVNFFSNSVSTRPCASSKDFAIKATDELVSNDVPEGCKQNPKISVEAEESENSKLRQSTWTDTLRSEHREIDTPPSKKANTVNDPLGESSSHAFSGRVTRSMATRLDHDCIIDDVKATRSRSAGQKHHSIDRSSKSKQQKDMLSVPSIRIDTVRSEHREIDTPPCKKVKTVNDPVGGSSSHAFSGRVTRLMATRLNHDYIIDDAKATQSRSAGQKHHSIDRSSKSKLQKDMLSVPSISIENSSNNSSDNGLHLNAAHTARNDDQISNFISSRLSEITLVEPEHCRDGVMGCNPDESTVCAFDVGDHENTAEVPIYRSEVVNIPPCLDSFTSMQLNEITLHASGTVQTTKEADRDTTEGPIEETREMEDSICDSHISCHDWKISGMTNPLLVNDVTCQTSENAPSSSLPVTDCELDDFSGHFTELQVSSMKSLLGSLPQQTPEQRCGGENIEFLEPGFDIFISNGSCDLNKNSLSSSISESQKILETSLKKLNSAAFKDGLAGGLIGDDTLRHGKMRQAHASNIVLEKEELETSNEFPGGQISRRVLDTVLSKSSLEKDCMLNSSIDSSGHACDLMGGSRKNSLSAVPSTGEEETCPNPKEVLKDVALAKKSEGSYPVETIHLPLRGIDEFDSTENHVADSGADNSVFDGEQDERCNLIGSNEQKSDSHLPVSNVDISIHSRSSFKENAAAYSFQDAGCMFNFWRGQNSSKERMSNIPLQYMEGETSTREPEDETLGGSLRWVDSIHCDDTVLQSSETNEMCKDPKETDCSAKEMMQIGISGPNLSPDSFQIQNKMFGGKVEAEEMGKVTSDSKKRCKAVQTRYFLRSSTGNNKHDAYDVTWPKRRKIKSLSNCVFATSPRLRAKTGKHVGEHLDSIHMMNLDHETKVELSDAALGSHYEEEDPNKNFRMMEDIKGTCQAAQTPMSVEHANEESYLDLADADSSVITEPTVLDLERYYALVGRQSSMESMDKFEHRSPTNFGRLENFTYMGQIHFGDESLHSHDSAGLSQRNGINWIGLEDSMPEFEGFIVGVPPPTVDGVIPEKSEISCLSKERASLFEQLRKSGSSLVSESCPSSSYNIHGISGVCRSLPADILERLRASIDLDQYRISKDCMEIDPCCSLGSQVDAYKLPSSNAKYAREARKPPLTPPFEKLQQKVLPRKSVSSSEESGSNPELVCFRIDENSSTTEEPTSELGVSSRRFHLSKNRAPLADVTGVYHNIPKSVSVSGKCLERGSLDSADIVPRSVIDSKDNDDLSAYRSSVQNSANSYSRRFSKLNSYSSRFSKPDISGNDKDRSRSRTTSEVLGKTSNIVSNMSSFIPLVQGKQQAAAPGLLGKRDIKVKALEAAESAKRLEEKRQHEREMRKAAAKLERARIERENIRKLELKQKEKEESMKKKEAEFETRKRQRELERIEKERKKRCTEEARKHSRVRAERSQIEKDKKNLLDKNTNMKKRKRKELAKDQKKHAQLAKVREVAADRNTVEAVPHISKAVSGHPTHETDPLETNNFNKLLKGVNNPSEMQNAIQDRMSVTTQSRDFQSYDISPFRDSDDETGDEDHPRKKKYIPPWARRESLDEIARAKCHLNPDEIFSRKRSFVLDEVLLPKKQPRP